MSNDAILHTLSLVIACTALGLALGATIWPKR